MNHNEHNGWWNYETWVVALWIDNEQGTQEHVRELAESALKNPGAYFTAGLSKEEMAAEALADTLKAMHEEALPEVEGFAADLLNAAMSEVNWMEIAKHHIDAAIEEEKANA